MSEYLAFERLVPAGRKTSIWLVKLVRSGATLGEIKWFGRWRQYAFFPAVGTVFNPDCLRDIIRQIENAMAERRKIRAPAEEESDD